jgi:hypothetical protein
MEKSVKIRNLVNETSEVSLNLTQPQNAIGLMGLETQRVVGGQKNLQVLRETYPTGIETRYSNGNIGADVITDTPEPGE